MFLLKLNTSHQSYNVPCVEVVLTLAGEEARGVRRLRGEGLGIFAEGVSSTTLTYTQSNLIRWWTSTSPSTPNCDMQD